MSAENSSSASLSMQAQAEAAAKVAEEAKKAEEARIAAEQQAAAQAQAEAEAAARAAQEAQQKTKEDDTPAWQQPATYDEPSYEPDPEPEPTPSGGSSGYTAEEEAAARAAGFDTVGAWKAFEEYANSPENLEKHPGLHIATPEELEAWGINFDD